METFKMVEKQELIRETINLSMAGNQGIAIVRLRKNLMKRNLPAGDISIQVLSKELIRIELSARKKMNEVINNYINSK